MVFLHQFLQALASERACLVSVEDIQGSTPRERGAWMAVFANHTMGTVGGGHVEFAAIARARAMLAANCTPAPEAQRYALGPSLGQCCGGVMHLRFELVSGADDHTLRQRLGQALQPLALFGGGHVGHALVRVLAPLPFALTWVDSRDGIFPEPEPAGVACEYSDPVQGAVPSLVSGTQVLIMSFSHAEDLDVVAACLERQRTQADLPFIGLIGSATKWATFRSRLRRRGFSDAELAHITCPIGVHGILGKQPEVIAVAVAAQLLQLCSAVPAGRSEGGSKGNSEV